MAGVHEIAKAVGIKDEQVVAVFDNLINQVRDGERVVIRDFGSFYAKESPARTITSPQIPGGKAEVPARMTLRFHAAPGSREALNGNIAKGKGTNEGAAKKGGATKGAAGKTAAAAKGGKAAQAKGGTAKGAAGKTPAAAKGGKTRAAEASASA
jgi:nucleoid DNA-binding protein